MLAKLLVTAALLTLWACGPSKNEQLQTRIDELTGQVSVLEEKLAQARVEAANIRTTADSLTASSSELEAAVTSFDTDNWQDTVPKVRETSEDIDTYQQTLVGYIDELDASLELD